MILIWRERNGLCNVHRLVLVVFSGVLDLFSLHDLRFAFLDSEVIEHLGPHGRTRLVRTQVDLATVQTLLVWQNLVIVVENRPIHIHARGFNQFFCCFVQRL